MNVSVKLKAVVELAIGAKGTQVVEHKRACKDREVTRVNVKATPEKVHSPEEWT